MMSYQATVYSASGSVEMQNIVTLKQHINSNGVFVFPSEATFSVKHRRLVIESTRNSFGLFTIADRVIIDAIQGLLHVCQQSPMIGDRDGKQLPEFARSVETKVEQPFGKGEESPHTQVVWRLQRSDGAATGMSMTADEIGVQMGVPGCLFHVELGRAGAQGFAAALDECWSEYQRMSQESSDAE